MSALCKTHLGVAIDRRHESSLRRLPSGYVGLVAKVAAQVGVTSDRFTP